MTSFARKLQHEVQQYVAASDVKIPEMKRYIVSIEIPRSQPVSKVRECAMKMLHHNRDHAPIFVYTFGFSICACFDGAKEMYRNGSVQVICSEYSSLLTMWLKTEEPVIATLVYFDTQPQVYAYFVWRMFILVRHSMRQLTTTPLSPDLTMEEMSQTLKAEGVDWDKKADDEKYGVFYRFRTLRKKKVIAEFSKRLDFLNYADDSKLLFDG